MTRGQVLIYLDEAQKSYLSRRRRSKGRPMSETVREALDLHQRMSEGGSQGDGKLGSALAQMIDSMAPNEVKMIAKIVWAAIEAIREARREVASEGVKGRRKEPQAAGSAEPAGARSDRTSARGEKQKAGVIAARGNHKKA